MRGRSSKSNDQQRLDGRLHTILAHKYGKHKDCVVCSNRKVKGGRHETVYFCDTCDKKPSLHIGECFRKYHTVKLYRD